MRRCYFEHEIKTKSIWSSVEFRFNLFNSRRLEKRYTSTKWSVYWEINEDKQSLGETFGDWERKGTTWNKY